MRLTSEAGVSVLIPLHNGVEFLPECLESVYTQTHQNLEVLIGVNGHAPDSEVMRRARHLSDSRTRVLHSETKSAPATLNLLGREAQHTLVCLIDADDTWLPEKVALQLEAFRAGHEVVGTFCRYFGERDGTPRLPAGVIPRDAFFSANPLIHSSVMLRREDVRFRNEYLYDYDLWLRLEASGRRFFNLDQPLTRHRLHSASAFNGRPDAETLKRALLRRHLGSARHRWLAKLLRRPAQRPTLETP